MHYSLFESGVHSSRHFLVSPLLYTLYVAQLDKICAKGSKILQYADEVCIYFILPTVNQGIQSLESSLEGTSALLGQLGLFISSFNSVFKGSRRKTNAYTLNVPEIIIPSSSKMQFLGLTIKNILIVAYAVTARSL